MRSHKVEYLRFDNPKKGLLVAGKPYLRMVGSDPVHEVRSPCDQLDLLRKLSRLRYDQQMPQGEKDVLIRDISDLLSDFFVDPAGLGTVPFQLDLVLNANELGLLPFELLLDGAGVPYFTSRERPLVLTRRIRQDFIEKKEHWPTVPRVLFAFANPGYGNFPDVPFREHRDALAWALRPWTGDDADESGNSDVLTVMPDVGLDSLSKVLLRANSADGAKTSHPYTHVHLLAHGALLPDPLIPNNPEYAVALCSDDGQPTPFDRITSLLAGLGQKPFVVSYMICDSGNNFNPLREERNIVQVTHEIGVPIVIGSQLPLTFSGSEVIVDGLYGGILNGLDVREAIHEVRCRLYENKDAGHDWLSMVAYVRLPEGYEDYLEESVLERELAALKTIGRVADALPENRAATYDQFEEVIFMLRERIRVLGQQMDKIQNLRIRRGVFEENAGLLGSAWKRLAELIFYRDKSAGQRLGDSLRLQREALEKAAEWYKKAADYNLSHHWSTVQYISLQAVLNGGFGELNYWHAALQAASNDAGKENEVWAYGSLAELHLLAPTENREKAIREAADALRILTVRARKFGNSFPVESTLRQFQRYARWWTEENGYPLSLQTGSMEQLQQLLVALD